MQYKFEAASQQQCDAKMREHCDDGLCWTVIEVFGQVKATSHATPANVPRTPASTLSDLSALYWRNGQWHKRRAATEAMERKVQAEADNAGGVSDGGAVDIAAWFRGRARKRKARHGKQ